MKKLISSIIFALFLTFPAMSEINIGVSTNVIGFYGEGTETETNNDGTNTKTQSAGAFEENFNSVFVEYDAGSVILGVSYSPETIETPKNTNLQNNSENNNAKSKTNTVKAEFENLVSFYAIVPTPLFGFYGKVGYSTADITTLELLETGGSYADTDTTGFSAGLGYEHSVDNFFVRLEALATFYDDVELDNINKQAALSGSGAGETTAKKIKVEEMMSANATLSVGYSF